MNLVQPTDEETEVYKSMLLSHTVGEKWSQDMGAGFPG